MLGLGVDLKAHGGYVIAPPSYHKSGNLYVHEGGRLAPFPAPLLRLARQLKPRTDKNEPVVIASVPAAVAKTKADLTRVLQNIKWKRADQATALCPAHDDSSPSFSVRVLPDGEPLFFCFAGCTYGDIMDALRERY